jgi:hypothetical protein
MPLSLPELLVRLTLVPVVVAGLIGATRFRLLPTNLRYLVVLIGFVLPLNVLGMVLLLLKQSNLFLMPLYAVGEFGLLAVVYARTLQSPTFTRLLPWLVGGFAVYVLLDSLHAPGLTQFRPGQQVMQGILVLSLVGLYFRKLLHELRIQSLQREPMFWVSAGLFIYYLGYLQIALFSNYLLQYSKQLNLSIWAVHSLLFMVLYGCYGLALWLRPQR